MIHCILEKNRITSSAHDAFTLFEKTGVGEKVAGKVQYMVVEALYLSQKGKMHAYIKNKHLSQDQFEAWCIKQDTKIFEKLSVYSYLKSRGYLPKAALKYGADFRVYRKGSKPGQEHAPWLVRIISNSSVKISELTSSTRIAHSTKKKLLLAVVDQESSPSFYQMDWLKP